MGNPTGVTRALLFGAALAVTGAALPSRGGADIITRRQEVTLGREAASQVEQAMPVDTDPVALARVRRVGRRLLAASEDKNLPFEFHTVDAGEVNAFALPGGFVYVYRGLLQLLPNDDALAFVLGHEMTHALRRHGTRQAGKNLALQALLTAALGGNAIAAQQLGAALASAKFSRDDENEADRRGIELMAGAGYNPDSAAETMEVLRRASEGSTDIPALLQSHPAPAARLRTLRTLAAEWKARPRPVAPNPGPAAVALAAPGWVEPAACGPLPFAAEASDFWPLRVGARWHYRVTGPEGTSAASVTVAEQLAAPAGVFRIERDLGRGIRQSVLVATGPGQAATHAANPSGEWRPEAVFDAAAGAGPLRCRGLEAVTVPAGRFDAVRVEQYSAAGALLAITWYARGVGPVRRQWLTAGIVEELERCWVPGSPLEPLAVPAAPAPNAERQP